jgi:hypothetical protein
MKDNRRIYNHQRIEGKSNVWHVDAKLDPAKKSVKVYRVYGDVNDPEGLDEALTAFFKAELERIDSGVQRKRGPKVVQR